jgi:hypoxanthine phosphoribosyltransferase
MAMKYAPNVDVLISADRIQQRVRELGAEIAQDFHGRELACIGVLKGSFVFLADLVRATDLPLRLDFLGLSSYGDDTKSSGVVRVTSDLSKPIEGKDVLVIEDIVDTGLTMAYLMANLETRKPRSVALCSLLHKPARTEIDVDIDYLGFTIPDKFVVGYGLDFDEVYRNLPYIGVLRAD